MSRLAGTPDSNAATRTHTFGIYENRMSVFVQLQQQQSRLMKINHDLRHKISVVEAQGKALIEQKVELEASAQARGQEVSALRQEVTRLRERLQGNDVPAQTTEEPPAQPPSPAEVTQHRSSV